jgi:hypothetical protein
MNKENGYYAYFAIRGNFETSEVIDLLKIKPLKAVNKGDLRPNGKTYYLESLINYEITKDDGDWDSIEALDHFVYKLSNIKDDLYSIKKRLDLKFHVQVVVHLCKESKMIVPAVGLSCKMIKFLASIDASFDVDLYNY